MIYKLFNFIVKRGIKDSNGHHIGSPNSLIHLMAYYCHELVYKGFRLQRGARKIVVFVRFSQKFHIWSQAE